MSNASDSNEITRRYYDSILLKSRYIDSDLPNMETTIFGRKFSTPIATAALSHMNGTHEKGMRELAYGAKAANAINFCGMESYEGEIDDIASAGAATIRIIKPHANNEDVFKRIEHAKEVGVFGVGMDIDHAFRWDGKYDVVEGLPMRPKTQKELESFVKAADGLPFVVKGVLSVEDAKKCVEIGASGIIVSHHHGILPCSVPPVLALQEIKEVVKGKLTIFVDCGIESGLDAFKAMALGADAVCIGRALMEPLKEGKDAVANKINDMTCEMASVMAKCGYRSIDEIDDKCIYICK